MKEHIIPCICPGCLMARQESFERGLNWNHPEILKAKLKEAQHQTLEMVLEEIERMTYKGNYSGKREGSEVNGGYGARFLIADDLKKIIRNLKT